MTLREWTDIGSTVVVAVAATVMALAYVGERFRSSAEESNDRAFVESWEDDNDSGIWRGSKKAPVVITTFVDFQCPFCAKLAPTLDSVRAEFADEVAFVFHHYPLLQHELALPAAVVAECARRQGRFWQMHDLLLRRQKEMGVTPWSAYGEWAGVPDIRAFARCVELPADSFPSIQEGRAIGRRTGVTGTPTTWVNGEVVRPSLAAVRERIEVAAR